MFFRALVTLSLTALPFTAFATDAPRVSLAAAAHQADAVVVATIGSPTAEFQAIPGTGEGPRAYVRMRWRVQLQEIVVANGATSARAGTGLARNTTILVDQAGWRADLAEHLRCAGGNSPCQWPKRPELDTSLSRPPRAGDSVLVLLKQTPDGWQLALDLGFDGAARAAELRAAKRAK